MVPGTRVDYQKGATLAQRKPGDAQDGPLTPFDRYAETTPPRVQLIGMPLGIYATVPSKLCQINTLVNWSPCISHPSSDSATISCFFSFDSAVISGALSDHDIHPWRLLSLSSNSTANVLYFYALLSSENSLCPGKRGLYPVMCAA